MKRFGHWGAMMARAVLAVFLLAGVLYARPNNVLYKKHFENAHFNLVKDERIRLKIFIPVNPTKDELEAAGLLKKYLVLCDPNAAVEITSGERPPNAKNSVTISKDPQAKTLSPRLDDFSKTVGNTIMVKKDSVEINYCLLPQNAVGDFLNILGFRFFTPTELGTHLPEKNGLKIPTGVTETNPQFLNALIFGASYDREWHLLNGGKTPLSDYSHNLHKIFDAEAMKEHPEFIPKVQEFWSAKNAQPNFAAKGATNFAARKADVFFTDNPGKTMFSVGINDSTVFDVRTPQNSNPDRFYRNYPNYSDAYFTFAAATARLISKEYPDNFVGCLAYLCTESVPNFALPQSLVPYVTSDRSANFNKEKRTEDFKLMEQWANSGVKIAGIYDYLNGAPYMVPRSIETFIWEGIEHAKKSGIRAYTSETEPVWPYDGARLWVTMRLLNGANEPPAKLEEEFYRKMYPHSYREISLFFRESKNVWENRSDTPCWISFYKRDSVAELFSAKRLKTMERYLKRAEKSSSDSAEKKRLLQLRLNFEVTKAFCEYYFARKELFGIQKETATDCILSKLKSMREAENRFAETRKVREIMQAYRFPKNEYKKEFFPPTDSLARMALSCVHDSQKAVLESVFGAECVENATAANSKRKMLYQTEFDFPEFATNETGVSPLPPEFRTRTIENGNTDFRITENENGFTLRIAGCTYAEITKFLNVETDKTYSFGFNADSRVSIGSTAYATLVFLDGESRIIARRSVSVPAMEKEENRSYELLLKAPENAKFAALSIIAWNMLDKEDYLRINGMSFEECGN